MQTIKTVYRLFKYKAEWKKQFREIKIRKQQRTSIDRFDPMTENLIVFFIPGADYFSGKENISGGLISIISLVEETKNIFKGTSTNTLCSTFYDDHLLFKINSFNNTSDVFNPRLIEQYFTCIKSLILHIPELFVNDFVCKQIENNWLKRIPSVQINILNQNILLMPNVDVIQRLKSQFTYCTITTAHKKYCNSELRFKYEVPLHQLSVWISPESYQKLQFEEKENLILFSPDNQELSAQIIDFLRSELKGYNYQIITGLSYEDYKQLITKAKFVITAGEGLDAYFIETYFSGGVAFAVKNLNFFDEKYLELPCLFNDDVKIENQINKLLVTFDNPENYNTLNLRVFKLLSQDYSYQTYQGNLKKFYNKEYTYA